MKKIYKMISYLITIILIFGFPSINVNAASNSSKIVTTQSQLSKALKNDNISRILIKPTKATKFNIKSGNYSKDLVIYEAKADVNNNGIFDNIEAVVTNNKEIEKALGTNYINTITYKTSKKTITKINEGCPDVLFYVDAKKAKIINKGQWADIFIKNVASWEESTEGNDLIVSSRKTNLTVDKNASIESVTVDIDKSTLNIKANGSIDSIMAQNNTVVNLTGSNQQKVLSTIVKEDAYDYVNVNTSSAIYSIDQSDQAKVVKIKNTNKTNVAANTAASAAVNTTSSITAKATDSATANTTDSVTANTTNSATASTPDAKNTITHYYVNVITKQPTCTETGIRTYTCTACGDSYIEFIPAAGHDTGAWHEQPATTTHTGLKVKACTKCGAVLESIVIPTLLDNSSTTTHIHKYVIAETKQSTCTETGIRAYTCSVCGYSYTEIIPAIWHDDGEWHLQPATTTYTGLKVRACTKCGAILETIVIPKLEDTIKPTATPIVTPTPAVKPTATPTSTPTPAVKPTTAPNATPTPTVKPTATPTVAPTATPTPAVNPTATPTPTVTPTVTPTPTVKPTASPTPTVAPTATPIPTAIPTPTPSDPTMVNGHKLVTVTIDMGNGQTKDVQGYYDTELAQGAYQALNQLRASKGLAPLAWHSGMASSADTRAAEIVIKFDHYRPNGEYCYYIYDDMIAENIAKGYIDVDGVMNGWINSSPHYTAMIRTDWKSVSLSCFMYQAIPGGQYLGYWSMLFAKVAN